MNKQGRLVVVISILASFVAFLDGSVVNVALPAIMRELGGGLSMQQWVVDAYLITLGSLILVAGSFSDLFGRKKVMLAGLIGFGITSLFCAVSPTGTLLIVSRGLQGIAGALLVPSSLALIMSAFSGAEQGKAIGIWTAWTGIAFIIGPLLGGFLVDAASWRWIFAINLLPIVINLWLLHSLRQPDMIRENTKIDVPGVLLCTVGLAGTVYGLIEQSLHGWTAAVVLVPLMGGLLSLAAFLMYEHRATSPMLPLDLFSARNFSVGNIATMFIYAGLSLSTFLVVIFLQQVGNYSAIGAGLALLPVTILMFFLSSRMGALAGKYGPRFFMATGPLVAAIGFMLILRVGTPVEYWTRLFPGVLLFGLGLSTSVAPLTSAILGAIEGQRAGIASAINNAVARVAGLIAIAAVGLVTGRTLDVSAFHRGILAIVILLVLGGVISALGITNKDRGMIKG